MKITKVEAIPLRIPDLDATRADGIQDDVIVRIHTDAGLTGVGEADASPEVVTALLKARASINVRTNDGRTPLIIAAREGNPPRVEISYDLLDDELPVEENGVDGKAHEEHVDRRGGADEQPLAFLESAPPE